MSNDGYISYESNDNFHELASKSILFSPSESYSQEEFNGQAISEPDIVFIPPEERNSKDKKPKRIKKRALLFDSDDEMVSISEYSYTENGKDGLKKKPSTSHHYHAKDWSPENIKTVQNWLKSVDRADHMNEYILEKYSKKLENYHMWALGVASLASVLASGSAMSQFNTDLRWLSLTLGIVNALVIFLTTFLNGLLAIKKWDKMTIDMTKYDEKLNGFFGILKLEVGKPFNLRNNAVDFIQKHAPTYLDIVSDGPRYHRSDELEAFEAYKEYLASKQVQNIVMEKSDSMDLD